MEFFTVIKTTYSIYVLLYLVHKKSNLSSVAEVLCLKLQNTAVLHSNDWEREGLKRENLFCCCKIRFHFLAGSQGNFSTYTNWTNTLLQPQQWTASVNKPKLCKRSIDELAANQREKWLVFTFYGCVPLAKTTRASFVQSIYMQGGRGVDDWTK